MPPNTPILDHAMNSSTIATAMENSTMAMDQQTFDSPKVNCLESIT